jgi:hypothetical protein
MDDAKNGTLTRDTVAAELELQEKATLKIKERVRREVRRELNAEERQAAAVPLPEILTLRERLARPRPPVCWRFTGVQAIGHRVLLAAQFKAGKTTLAANVARSALDGDAFLGAYSAAPVDGAVALLDFEMSATQLDTWYADQQIQNDDRLFVFPMRGAASAFDILNPEVRSEWVTTLQSRRIVYLILDCLRPVLDALGLNEHTEVGLFLTALDHLLRAAGIPEALVIQHMGHTHERARGDSRLRDWPDVEWTLVREKPDDLGSARYFRAYGRDVDVTETQLSYDQLTRRLFVVGLEEGGLTRTSAKVEAGMAFVCQLLESVDAPQSQTSLEKAGVRAGVPRDAIRKGLQLAVETGAVVAVDGGRGGGNKYRSAFGPRPDWLPGLNSASPPNSAKPRHGGVPNSASPPPPIRGGGVADLPAARLEVSEGHREQDTP